MCNRTKKKDSKLQTISELKFGLCVLQRDLRNNEQTKDLPETALAMYLNNLIDDLFYIDDNTPNFAIMATIGFESFQALNEIQEMEKNPW